MFKTIDSEHNRKNMKQSLSADENRSAGENRSVVSTIGLPRLFRGEVYRLLHKKSLYIYSAALMLAYFILAFIRSNGFNEESVVSDALSLFSLLPAFVGGFLFAAIYTDDLNSKNLISLVGFGIGKAKIIIVKLLLLVLFATVLFMLAPLYHCAIYTILGQAATKSMIFTTLALSIKYLLATIAFSTLSGIVVYGMQRATFAIVTYFLLVFGVVSSFISIGLDTFAPTLTKHQMPGITDRIFAAMTGEGSLPAPVLEYVIYMLIVMTASILAFKKKEMEF